MAEKKNILIVYAHQEPKSFNAALKDIAVEVLQRQGHSVVVSDLYKMEFNPSACKSVFKDSVNPEHFKLQHELRHAVKSGKAPDGVGSEIEKALAADLIILQFPMYWFGFPAIMKGWIDKCFADHVFIDIEYEKWFDESLVSNKKILISMTTHGTAKCFSNSGLFGDMEVVLWPMQNALRVCGFNILSPQVSYAPEFVSEDERKHMLQNWKDRLPNIWTEEPVKFINLKHFEAHQLTEEYVKRAKEGKEITTVGQHLGLPLPGNNTM